MTGSSWAKEKGVEIPSFTSVRGGSYSYTCSVNPEYANSGADYGKFLESAKDSMGMHVADMEFIVDPSSNYPSYPGLAVSGKYKVVP